MGIRRPGGARSGAYRLSPLPVVSGATAGGEPRPHTPGDACGTGGVRAAEANTRDVETGAGFFTTCGGVLRGGVAMRY